LIDSSRRFPEVSELAKRAQEETAKQSGSPLAFKCTQVKNAADAAEKHGVKLEVAQLPTARRGFILLPRR